MFLCWKKVYSYVTLVIRQHNVVIIVLSFQSYTNIQWHFTRFKVQIDFCIVNSPKTDTLSRMEQKTSVRKHAYEYLKITFSSSHNLYE